MHMCMRMHMCIYIYTHIYFVTFFRIHDNFIAISFSGSLLKSTVIVLYVSLLVLADTSSQTKY